MIVFCGYQMMFAIITPALITGAFTNRVTFKAYMLFLTAWLIFVYFPFVHMVWGGGILSSWGVKDFAGGIVVHNIAGIAALASVIYVGRRKVADTGPHSVPLVALGTGLLWFGWYGFNAGSEFKVDSVTAVAFLNTDIAASFAAMAWLAVDWMTSRKPRFLGIADRRRCRIGNNYAGGRLCFARHRLPDRHYCRRSVLLCGDSEEQAPLGRRAGCVGRARRGRIPGNRAVRDFATTEFNPAGVDGLLRGNTHFFLIQLAAVAISSAWAFIFTYVMLWLIDWITVVNVDEAGETAGLDQSLHGEVAYPEGI